MRQTFPKCISREEGVSQDYNTYVDWSPKDIRHNFKVKNLPWWSYHHITADVLPNLREEGVSET